LHGGDKLLNYSEERKEIGVKFKQIRENLGMNQTEFAQILSMSHQTAPSKIERGEAFPTIPVLKAISKLSNISLDFILTGKEFKPMPKKLQAPEKIELLTRIDQISTQNREINTKYATLLETILFPKSDSEKKERMPIPAR